MKRFFVKSSALLLISGVLSSSAVFATSPDDSLTKSLNEVGKSETSALDDGNSTDATKAKNSNETDDCKFTDTSKTETQTYNNDSATSERKKSSDNFYEDYSRRKLQKEPEGNNDENSEIRSVDSRIKKLLKQLLRSELLEQLLAHPQAFAVLLFFAYCLTIRPIKFIWLRDPVKRALLEAINKEILSARELKNSLEKIENRLNSKLGNAEEELKEVEKEISDKESFLSSAKNEIYAHTGKFTAFETGKSFLQKYIKNLKNSTEKLIQDEKEAYEEGLGQYDKDVAKEKADELLKNKIGELENEENLRISSIEKFSNEIEEVRLNFEKLNNITNRHLQLIKDEVNTLKTKKERLNEKLTGISQRTKLKLEEIHKGKDEVLREIEEKENKKREIERRSVCRDFCTYLIHQQA